MIYGESKVSICEIMGFVRIFWKSNVQKDYLLKTSISGQIASEKLAELCSDDSHHKNPSKFDLSLKV